MPEVEQTIANTSFLVKMLQTSTLQQINNIAYLFPEFDVGKRLQVHVVYFVDGKWIGNNGAFLFFIRWSASAPITLTFFAVISPPLLISTEILMLPKKGHSPSELTDMTFIVVKDEIFF